MPHVAEDVQQLGGEHRVDAAKHAHSTTLWPAIGWRTFF